jgi:hypothetical protein
MTLDRIDTPARKQCYIKAAAIVTGQTDALRIWPCSRRQEEFLVKVIEAVEIEDFLQGDDIGIHFFQKPGCQPAVDRVQTPAFGNFGIPGTVEPVSAINTFEPEILDIQCCDKHDDDTIAQSRGVRKTRISGFILVDSPGHFGNCQHDVPTATLRARRLDDRIVCRG